MSTLGTQHILERMGPGPLTSRHFQNDNRDPSLTDDFDALGRQQMFHPKGTPALIDRIDSGNMTEDIHQRATTGRRASTTALGMLAAAMCMVPGMGNSSMKGTSDNDMDDDVVDAALAYIKKGVRDDSDYLGTNLRKNLSPIEEGEDISPRNGGITNDPENPMPTMTTAKLREHNNSRSSEGSEVIDLTNLASPISPSTQDGIKGAVFSFDDIMDVAASKLTRDKDGDRYAVEDDTSPRKAMTPKASGGQNSGATSRQVSRTPSRQLSSTPSRQASNAQWGQERAGMDRTTTPGQISPQSSFEVYEHPEGDIVMWSENPVQEKEPSAPKEFNGNFSDGLFDLLSTDESVSRGRKKVPFLAENQGASLDDTHESTDEVEEANACMFDLTLGACGRVKDPPIQRSIKNGLNHMSALVTSQHGSTGGTMSDDNSDEGKINPNFGVMCGAVPLYFMYRNSDKGGDQQNVSDPTKTKSVDFIKIQDDLAARAAKESTPESYQDRLLPVVLPEKEDDMGLVDDSNQDFVISLPQNVAPAASNILLARDDAYWDTLSTIASTKDKSAGSVNVVVNEDTTPGPIPVEITMKNKPLQSAILNHESQMTQSIGKISNLMVDDDDSSAESLSKQLAAIAMEQHQPSSEHKNESVAPRGSDRFEHVQSDCAESLSKQLAAIAMEQHQPSSEHKNESVAPRGSDRFEHVQSDSADLEKPKNDSVRSEESMNDVPERRTEDPDSHSSKVGSPKENGAQADASELLLAVTRSDGNDEARMASPSQSPQSPSNGWQVRGMSKPFRISQETLQEASSGLRSYVPKSPESTNRKQVYSSLNVHSKHEVIFPSATTSVHKPDPLAASMSNNAFVNPWKNSNRSVSWGVEEIYEATSPTSSSGMDAPQGTSNDDILAVAAGAASQVMSQQKALSPISVTTQSPSATSSSQLSARDEQELISRTLILSKQLLSSMAIQELGGVDNDFMKSLMSFGTEDGKLSLPSPESKTVGLTEVRSLADSSTSSPALEAVQVDHGKMRPRTPISVRHLGPAPGSVREAIEATSGMSADPPEVSDCILPSASGRSEDSPIDVEELFSKYDNLANDLIGENAKLQGKATVGPTDENTTATSTSPKTMSRLDQLRAHRAQAMAKLQVGTIDRQFGNRVSVDVNQRKDRVSAYSQGSLVNPRLYEVAFGSPPVPTPRIAPKEDELETASSRSASSTPSMKARELRRQLDEAIQASRNIKESQEQLGSELEHFKNRFYRKNDALEDQAVRAIGGL